MTEQLAEKSPALTALALDWRKLLFPEANDQQFADGYAQAVTFGLLMARSSDIRLANGLDQVAKQLGKTNSLIGAALRLLTDEVGNEATLKTSLGTLVRVLDAVNWHAVSKGKSDAWLYFYEDFLAEYDNKLRKLTGSYYTPPEVVGPMIRLVDDVLRRHFNRNAGLASADVTLADPAVGTGTFILGVLRRIATDVEADQGAGAVAQAIESAIGRLIAFEIQLGPFAVAQLRIYAELMQLIGKPPRAVPRMFVTDTLGNPFAKVEELGSMYRTISESRLQANEIKRKEPITVVIGNPPYKEKAKGRGGWIEEEPLKTWIPPADWGVGAHAKHLRNLYVYFWRWATWKVFDRENNDAGIVCFITVAGFLNGPGFQKMRDYLRRTADRVWVIDCSPEGHQPDVPTRIFQAVQQPVCIVLAARSKRKSADKPAGVKYTVLPAGKREEKFAALAKLNLDSKSWQDCPTDWRAPFLPAATGDWASYPALDELFAYNGAGVQPKRVWVIAPDAESLKRRWDKLIEAPIEKKEALFHATLRGGKPADRHIRSIVRIPLPGYELRTVMIVDEKGPCPSPIHYGFRTFNRQWIIPDPRVITQPNADLWESYSARQVYLTALMAHSPTSGPALTFTYLIPDLHHYKGSFGGRVFPLWRDAAATTPNMPPKLLEFLTAKYKRPVSAEDFLAYVAGVAANPAYTARFQKDLAQPGLRIPITAQPKLFAKAVELGRRVIWLHTFGERFADARADRPPGPPRVPKDRAPRIPKDGAIPDDPDSMPDEIGYDEPRRRLLIGTGFVDNVAPAVWGYEVSGKRVLTQWFSYRKKNRERPIIGDRRPPSKLGDIQPDHWLAEYTTELLNVLHLLTLLVEMEPDQAKLMEAICEGPTLDFRG